MPVAVQKAVHGPRLRIELLVAKPTTETPAPVLPVMVLPEPGAPIVLYEPAILMPSPVLLVIVLFKT